MVTGDNDGFMVVDGLVEVGSTRCELMAGGMILGKGFGDLFLA